MTRIFSVLLMVFLLSTPAFAREIAGVDVPEQIAVGNGVDLHLNGAGIRYKFFFKIYIAELYMEHPAAHAGQVIKDDGQKRVVMHFIYSEVEKDQLVDGWNEDFQASLGQEKFDTLKDRVNHFNDMFETVKSGDEILMDYIPGKGTQVTINGKVKGVVPGKDFNDALLGLWLGKEPISSTLRTELLDYSKHK
jgi:hypothetical protein